VPDHGYKPDKILAEAPDTPEEHCRHARELWARSAPVSSDFSRDGVRGVSAILDALLAELTDGDEKALTRLADRLAPLLAKRLVQPAPDGWLRGAEQIASYIGSPRSRVYALTSARRIPVQRDGSTLVARRSELDSWLHRGGGKRP
jgi:excisionase family DNA binding protein